MFDSYIKLDDTATWLALTDRVMEHEVTYKGKKHSVLSAKCVDGKIQAHITAKFYDNSQLSADVLRTCTSKP